MSHKRSFGRTVLAGGLLAFFLLLGMRGNGLCAFGAEKPEYLKAVTYFGDEWPINYWGSEDKDMDANLAGIKADGFNSIILVVPWREFQPVSGLETYNQAAFDRLDTVMDCAGRHGLWVVLRIGYDWDYYGESEFPARYQDMLQKDGPDWKRWMEYSGRLYRQASAHENFHSGFITWEDFWNATYTMKQELPVAGRIKLAQSMGYTEYLEKHYSLLEVSDRYGNTFTDFSQVYLPDRMHPSAGLFYEFYDQFLMELLQETQRVFPGLSMEVRGDGDRIYDTEGSYSYYSHKATYACEGAPYSALMYSVSMSQLNEGNKISADEALVSMGQKLNTMYASSRKKFFVEQLLYMDSTEEFSYNTQIEEDQVDDFIRRLKPVLSETTCGYGLWVYRNYVNNCVYNGQFGLGKTGWEFSSGSAVETRNGTPMVRFGKGGAITQRLTGRLGESSTIKVRFHGETDGASAYVKVGVGNMMKRIEVDEAGTYTAEFPWTDQYDITLSSDQKVYLDDIKVYTYEQYGRIYGVDGEELDLAGAFRELNGELGS